MAKKIGKEIIESIKKDLLHGLTGWEVADRNGVSVGTVQKIRKEVMAETPQASVIWHPRYKNVHC